AVHGEAKFLLTLLLVPLAEPLLFLHAPSQRAFALTMDGVTINFSLHTLLSPALSGPLGHAAPLAEIVRRLNGAGPGRCGAGRRRRGGGEWGELDPLPLARCGSPSGATRPGPARRRGVERRPPRRHPAAGRDPYCPGGKANDPAELEHISHLRSPRRNHPAGA